MISRTVYYSLCLVMTWGLCPTQAVQIRFDYRYDAHGFFQDSSRRSALEAAASHFESMLLDSLEGIASLPLTSDQWTAQFTNPSTGELVSLRNLTVEPNTLLIFVGAKDLSGESIGFGGPGGYEVSGTTAWVQRVSTRGQPKSQGEGATDFAPWGGSIAFDTHLSSGASRNWHFGVDTLPGAGQTDFLTTAMHEIGHVLGFGTASSFTRLVNPVTMTFQGAASLTEHGRPVPLHDDLAHFSDRVEGASRASGLPSETLFDPTQTNGKRKLLTWLDLAALRDIGWELRQELRVLAADANGDGTVNLQDFDLVKRFIGSTGTKAQGDFNGDARVDLLDFGIVKADLARTTAAVAGIVPEPTGGALVLVGFFSSGPWWIGAGARHIADLRSRRIDAHALSGRSLLQPGSCRRQIVASWVEYGKEAITLGVGPGGCVANQPSFAVVVRGDTREIGWN